MTSEDIIQTILKDSNYHLSLFSEEEIDELRKKVFTKETIFIFIIFGRFGLT